MLGKLEIWFEESGWDKSKVNQWIHLGSSSSQGTLHKIIKINSEFILFNKHGNEIGSFKDLKTAKDAHAILLEVGRYFQFRLGMKVNR